MEGKWIETMTRESRECNEKIQCECSLKLLQINFNGIESIKCLSRKDLFSQIMAVIRLILKYVFGNLFLKFDGLSRLYNLRENGLWRL